MIGSKAKEKIAKRDIGSIYFIAGILHPKIYSRRIKKSIESELLPKKLNKVKITFFDDIFYTHLEHKKERRIIINIIKHLKSDYKQSIKSNNKILILAHSWGGILAKTAIAEFLARVKSGLLSEDYSKLQNNIVLVTMATPHTMTHGGTGVSRNKLSTLVNIPEIKVYTFGGIFDVVVPVRFTFIENDKKIAPNTFFKKVRATHMMFLSSPRIQREIFNSVFK